MTGSAHKSAILNVGEAERLVSLLTGGVMLYYGIRQRSLPGIAVAGLGGAMLHRGYTGHCEIYRALGMHPTSHGRGAGTSVPYELGVRVDRAVTINRPVEEVYAFWRKLDNLPRFMRHLQSVGVLDEKRSHWVVRGPAGRTFEWDAEIHNEVPNELIGFRSLAGNVDIAGSVRFRPAPAGRGTEVGVELQYNPPGGFLSSALAKVMGSDPDVYVREDLRRFKQLMETGEIPRTEGQPTGERSAAGRMLEPEQHIGPRRDSEPHGARLWNRDRVERAGQESFPASDPPSFTPETL